MPAVVSAGMQGGNEDEMPAVQIHTTCRACTYACRVNIG